MTSHDPGPAPSPNAFGRRALLLGLGGAGAASVLAPTDASAAVSTSATRTRLTARLIPLAQPYDIGIAVKDWRTGQYWTYRGTRAYNLASCVKVPTAISMARYARARGRAMTSTEKSMVSRAIRVSDNDAQQYLWDRTGGGPTYDRTCAALGMSSASHHWPGYGWGRAWSTPRDFVTLLNSLMHDYRGVTREDAVFIRDELARTRSDQIWGVGAMGRVSGRTVRVKDGWVVLSNDGTWRINSIGHVRDSATGANYSAAILSRGWGSMSTGVTQANRIGREIFAALSAGRL